MSAEGTNYTPIAAIDAELFTEKLHTLMITKPSAAVGLFSETAVLN